MNPEQTRQSVDRFWDQSIIPALSKYIEIPNQSPLFDPDWKKNGHMDRAVALAKQWVLDQKIPGAKVEVFEEQGKTPVLFVEVDGTIDKTVLLYGHLDKQPAMVGWDKDLSPWKPVLRDGKLYGRGAADDGYAVFGVVSAIRLLKEQRIEHPRLVVLIECCEESGSVDLPHYVNKLSSRIGTPGLIVCLDSGCGNYEQLWATTSLRGSVVGNLTVEMLSEGVHSGDASGIVASTFRVLRILLDRLEDAKTGRIKPDWLWANIPKDRKAEMKKAAKVLKKETFDKFPFLKGVRPITDDPMELLLNRTWRPALAITGQEGLPDLLQAGNVLRPMTALKLSLRLPPTLDANKAAKKLKKLLESDPPYGAKVSFVAEKGGTGWQAPELAKWLEKSIEKSSKAYFGRGMSFIGEGGSIPFMGMLGEKFPKAQFLITGVLGPHSNAHGPNEFLHIQTGKNISACVAQVIEDYAGA